jgi:hypothetical protein
MGFSPLPAARRPDVSGLARRVLAGLGALALTVSGRAGAQAAIDPSVAPRAAALEREGERALATDMLGRYLAVAPDDGEAWFQLGRFYLLDARDWHRRAHPAGTPGPLYLDFAATALEQSVRLNVDSAVVFRALVEMDRALVFVEDSGWAAARERRPRSHVPPLPGFVLELGANLLNSCPADGVLLTGNDLETVAVWYESLERGRRPDVLPLRPELYATDPHYRARMAAALGVDSALTVQRALAQVAGRRPICLSPRADSAAAPTVAWSTVRLVRVSRAAEPTADVLTVTEYVRTTHAGGSVWSRDVHEIYLAAARRNPLLCVGLAAQLGATPGACAP